MKIVNKSYLSFLLLIATLASSAYLTAQNNQYRYFTITAGVNFVENDNDDKLTPSFQDMDFTNPLFLGLEGRISEAFSWSLLATSNQLELVDGRNPAYFGIDTMFNWYFDSLLWDNNDIEWSLGGGAGYYSLKGERAFPTVNVGSGVRWWFLDWLAVSAQGTGKFALSDASNVENYYQYNIGLVWGLQVKPKKELPQEEESSELEEMAQQEERTATQSVQPAKPAADNDMSGEDMQLDEPKPIMVESVYFDRNSSYLAPSETGKLDELINTLKEQPELRVEIETYTDATGKVTYNNWLAEQRLKRTSDYITERGIPASRIEGQPIGVDPASEECVDCSVEDQRIYRRAEFRVYRE